MTDIHRLFIDGAWRDVTGGPVSDSVTTVDHGEHPPRGETIGDVIDPSTEEAVSRVALAGVRDVDDAIAAAERALATWRRSAVERRAAILREAAAWLSARLEAAAVDLTREQGKPIAESRAEFLRAVETLAWHADAASRILEPRLAGDNATIVPEPIGVVGAFVPWNYPAVIAARKLGAALAAGCTVVMKGAEEAPGALVHIVRALEEAGMPAGVVNLLFGHPPLVSQRILDHAAVRAFSFTGSTLVGKQLAARAAQSLKRCVFELGGHAPVIVFADADLDAAVAAIAAYKFECAGQSCNAPSRLFVHAHLHDAFVSRFAAHARALRVGDGRDPATQMGPMIHARRIEAMARLTADARARGATLQTGGARLERRGFYWPPTVLTHVPDDAAVMREEPFGPLLPILAFEEYDDVIARANRSAYGLAAYVFTASGETARAAVRDLEAGSVGVNALAGVPPHVGIAGVKDSGHGYEGGAAGVEAFLNLKAVRRS